MSSEKCSLCETPTALESLILFEGKIICHSCDGQVTTEKNDSHEKKLKDLSPEELHDLESHLFLHQLLERTPKTYFTKAIIAINSIIFAAMIFYGVPISDPSANDLIPWGAANGHLITHGEWWRMFTSTFLHFGILHLVFNMYVLKDVGQLVEKIIGNKSFLVIYVIAAFCGSVASVIFHPYASAGAGASGAVFGVYGALLGILVILRNKLPKEMVNRLKKGSLFFLVINLVYGMSLTNIDMAAHTGGMLGGFICGMVMSQNIMNSTAKRRLSNSILCIITALGLCTWAYSAKDSIIDIEAEKNQLGRSSDYLVNKYHLRPQITVTSNPLELHSEENARKEWQALRNSFEQELLPLKLPLDKERLQTYMNKRFTLGLELTLLSIRTMHAPPTYEQIQQRNKDLATFNNLEL